MDAETENGGSAATSVFLRQMFHQLQDEDNARRFLDVLGKHKLFDYTSSVSLGTA